MRRRQPPSPVRAPSCLPQVFVLPALERLIVDNNLFETLTTNVM